MWIIQLIPFGLYIRSICLSFPVAPIKALCSQCFENWNMKFGPLGLNCKELTGDTEIDDFFEIQDSHIILTTPVCTAFNLDPAGQSWEDGKVNEDVN